MPKILTISELTRDLKEVLENIFQEVCVEGEISNLRLPGSGHMYFSLKDTQCALRCVLFKNAGVRLKFAPADGLSVVASGRIGVYGRDGTYQLYVNALEPKGTGALQLAFEQLKNRLAQEGLFDEGRKKALPFLPEAIGVVTSPTGAVIRDILQILERRFPQAHVVINPVRVQGEGAAVEIARAVGEFNAWGGVDVIILARGGGSLEDLWSFNEEVVARAIYASHIPVVSAVGHETDYTIADFVADKRAPTPSAAAEMVMPSRAELDERIGHLVRHLWRSLADVVPQHSQHIDDLSDRMRRALVNIFEEKRIQLDGFCRELEALNPLAILRRGYSVTMRQDGAKALRSVRGMSAGERIRTRFADGSCVSRVEEIVDEPAGRPA
ncbi:MAG: exodeoxyribonuclease VII large subunit [Candidatus Omnitrophica bacterium]|nr:exodeoxyribonuclease VII large subunit [Candidatus Omnitrophota bacterium]